MTDTKPMVTEKPKTLNFQSFVLQDLTKEERVRNVLNIVLQDVYLFMERIAQPLSPEWEKIAADLEQLITTKSVSESEEGECNRQKDSAIRSLFIHEELRQYINFLKNKK